MDKLALKTVINFHIELLQILIHQEFSSRVVLPTEVRILYKHWENSNGIFTTKKSSPP